MSRRFDELPWHDAVLLGIGVDRTSPGNRDELTIDVGWPDGARERVRFHDCYQVDLQLNFGVLGPDSVRSGDQEAAGPELSELQDAWARSGVDLGSLTIYRITTNVTASRLVIVARSFSLERPPDLPP